MLSGGKVIQYDTPDEIYNRPAAKFVAGFTGSPAMNFANAEIASDGASAVVGDVSVALPENLRAAPRLGKPIVERDLLRALAACFGPRDGSPG